MFHTYRMAEVYLSAALAPGVLAIAFIDNVRRALKGSHCLSGCGQEKMSTLWFAGVGHSALLLPSSDGSATMTHQAAPRGATTPFPTGLNQPVGRQTSWGSSTALAFGSGCPASISGARSGDTEALGTWFSKWPKASGEDVRLRWRIVAATSDASATKFRRRCWRPVSGSNSKTVEAE
jgi:hypothetical protein